MAPIVILISSTIGFFTGLVQFAFFGVTLWQAFVTYFSVSITLSVLALAAALITDHRARRHPGADVSRETLETWQDWHVEEEMEIDRLTPTFEEHAKRVRIGRNSA